MTGLRAADLRFLLPRPPTSVALVGAAAAHHAAWTASGVPVVDAGADLVVGGPGDLAAILHDRLPMMLSCGRMPVRRLAGAGYRSTRVLALPNPTAPRLLVPLASRVALRAALEGVGRRSFASTAVRAAAGGLLERGVAPPRMTVTVATRAEPPASWLLGLLDGEPAESDSAWFLWLGDGDPLQRAVLHRVGPGGGQVVKFSRVAGNTAPFEREVAVARTTARLPVSTIQHVPVPLRNGTIGALPFMVERRFAGRPLTEALLSRWPAARKLLLVEAVASWLHDVAAATVAPPSALAGERERLSTDVVPAWRGAPADLVAATAGLPGVLAHNDVGTWNVVADRHGGFGVVDWESATDPGLPLWDLAYFLADALTLVELGRFDGRTDAMLDLFRGRSPHSDLLFAHVRRAAGHLGISPDVVAPVVTLGWLHHGLSAGRRRGRLDELAGGAPADRVGPVAGLAEPWLRDPELGIGWKAWR